MRLTLTSSVATTYFQLLGTRARLAIARDSLATAERVLKLVDARYRNGVANALDLQDAQRSLFTAQLAATQTRLSQLQNQVLLYKALGGGWSSRDDAAASQAQASR